MKVIYIAGFRQHAGKTMTSLGIISLLKKYFPEDKIGYIKPVGQELFTLPDGSKIDKDGKIIEQFVLPHIDMGVISPVRLGSGVTKNFLKSDNPEAITKEFEHEIYRTMEAMSDKEIVIAEGTGHPGVGAIVGLSNARVSQMLNADILFLAGGGVGKTLDMLETDMSYLKVKGARVKGLVFNKLLEDKIDSMKDLVSESLINKYFGMPEEPISVLGYLPEVTGLDRPSMKLIQGKFPDSYIAGKIGRNWENPIGNIKIISLSHESFAPEQYVEPGDLVILTADSRRRLSKLLKYNASFPKGGGINGIILTCMNDSFKLKERIALVQAAGVPAFYVREDTSTTDSRIHEVIKNTKIQPWDENKMKKITELFEKYFDFDKFVRRFDIKLPDKS